MASKKKIVGNSISTAAARQNFSDLINRVAYGKDRVVLTRRNRSLAAVIPFEDLALLEEIEDREVVKAARAALRQIKRTGTNPLDQVLKESGIRRRRA
ncbi:MAG TPA: type II toxin-antitoxin system Phd/YefM family antitoxin [Candidatus Binataceae bacterium]|nr:type II toxin-antitoxin system Phd/YefM family antitoxin [Candidatus Binataceae bacterium]